MDIQQQVGNTAEVSGETVNKSDEDYDFRQYRQMESVIDRYNTSKKSKKVTDLQRLITGLDALRSCLEKPSQRFNEIFHSQWATLEEVNAMMQYQEKHQIDEIGEELVGNAIREITTLLRKELQSRGDSS